MCMLCFLSDDNLYTLHSTLFCGDRLSCALPLSPFRGSHIDTCFPISIHLNITCWYTDILSKSIIIVACVCIYWERKRKIIIDWNNISCDKIFILFMKTNDRLSGFYCMCKWVWIRISIYTQKQEARSTSIQYWIFMNKFVALIQPFNTLSSQWDYLWIN